MIRRLSRPPSPWLWIGLGLSLVALHLALGASPYPPFLVPTLMRVPLELAVLLAALTFAPAAWVRPIRWGVLLLLLVFVPLKLLDVGFFLAFDRPFDPVLDFYLLPAGWTLLKGSVGLGRAAVMLGGFIVVLVLMVVGFYWALRGLTLLRERPRLGGGVAALLAVLALIPLGDRVGLPGAPAVLLAADHVETSARNLKDVGQFRKALGADPFKGVPNDRLLAALRGKDVILVFVESYGRGALDEPRYASVIQSRLSATEREIAQSGFQARSGWMRSPTHGGQSWLAHETLLSGLWVDGGSRYEQLVRSTHPTLIGDFHRAGWRTAAIMPAISEPWPEGKFFGYDRIYGARDLGYRGLPFNWITMPDQFTFLAFKRAELDRPNRGPVMAEITLLSSHAPFVPIPRVLPWDAIGDGKAFNSMVVGAETPESVWRNPTRLAQAYAASIDYSLASLSAFVRDFGDDRTVVIALGDHQPGGTMTEVGGPHEVPVHIFAKDPKVLDAISAWGWRSGMRPDPKGPVMRMDQFRERLISSFTPGGR